MTKCKTLFIGSMPAAGVEEAMRMMLDGAGEHLCYLPDGEPPPRNNWIINILETVENQHPALEVRVPGDNSDYDKMRSMRVRSGHTFTGDHLNLGYATAFQSSRPVFRKLCMEYGYPHMVQQVGVASDLDLSMATFGKTLAAFKQKKTYTDALVREISSIHEQVVDPIGRAGVLFQIEMSFPVVLLNTLPPLLRPLVADHLGRGIANLVRRCPFGALFGLHLCLGDYHHNAATHLEDMSPVVLLSNAIVRHWPRGRQLAYLHLPMAHGDKPSPSDWEGFYAPLRRLRAPEGTRVVAGFLHEHSSMSDLRWIRNEVNRMLGRPFDVAASCGLGRRSVEDAALVMSQAAQLCSEQDLWP